MSKIFFNRKQVDMAVALKQLNKDDGNPFPKNPFLIHIIQDKLIAMKGETVMHQVIKKKAKTDIKECIVHLYERYNENPSRLTELIGNEIMDLIEEYTGRMFADDLPPDLYNSYSILHNPSNLYP